MTAFCKPWSEIVATIHQAQIADGQRDYEGQLAAIEDAIEHLDKLRTSTEIAMFDAAETAFDGQYDKKEAAE